MPRIGAQFQLRHQRGQLEVRPGGDLVVDQFGQRSQRLPTLTGLGAGGCLGGEAERFEQFADQLRQFPVRAPVGGALQRHQ